MSKLLWQMLKTSPIALGSTVLLASGAWAVQVSEIESVTEIPAASFEIAQNSELLQQIDSYSSEEINGTLGQGVEGAAKFRDVSPSDWAYQALNDLIIRYDCLVGYPDGTFRGNRALSRYEFAAGLNACLNQIERLIAAATADFVTREDLETLRRLMQEFETELASLGTRVDNLEARTAFLEDHQFSTTTKLRGEVIFQVADLFTDTDQQFDTNFNRAIDAGDNAPQGGNTIFAYRVRLNFDTSFTGKDLLRIRLQDRNISTLTGLGNADDNPTDFSDNVNFTREGRFGTEGNTNGVEIDNLLYRFPILDGKGRVHIWANSGDLKSILDPISPFASSGSGALSRFGRYNPIYRAGGQNAMFGLELQLNDWIGISGAYTAGEANNAGPGEGLFNGDYAVGGQIMFEPLDGRLKLSGTFIHGYQDNGFNTGTGTQASQFRVRNVAFTGSDTQEVPVVSNNYGVNALFEVTDSIFVGGWGGYSAVRAINTGDGDIWNYAAYLGVNDLGGKGNRLGVIVGREPYLAGSDFNIGQTSVNGLGNALGNRADDDSSFHFEGFYQIKVSKHVQITPGIIVITNPGAQDLNDTLWIGTIRTTFKF
ncbi:iron uptake porin [Lusitaniella coriacea]|uniref:iron uptake porin n=1 Tax=Lusitaniella coriacea TaxID=1983105 RepID=UPI003CE67A31